MLVTTKTLAKTVAHLERQIEMLDERYWKLYHRHERLMAHLGLYEVEKSGVEIRSKGGPEKGED